MTETPTNPEQLNEEAKGSKTKTGNWRPGEKVPKTGTYKCIMCGSEGAMGSVMNTLFSATGRKPSGLAVSQSTSSKFFREGELFTKCPNCVALATDAGTTTDMTGWDFVSAEEVKSEQPTPTGAPRSNSTEEQGHCDVCNESIDKSKAKVVTTAVLRQATQKGYCGKQSPFASALGFDKKAAWEMTLNMGAVTNWALCAKCSEEVQLSLNKKDSSCFIATIAFANEDCPELVILRSYRDQILRQHLAGRVFLRLYNKLGPHAARVVGYSALFKTLVRKAVAPLVRHAKLVLRN